MLRPAAETTTAVSAPRTRPDRRPPGRRTAQVSSYTELARQVREAGLLRRCYGYYWPRIGLAVLSFAAVWAVVVRLGHSWWVLLAAVALAVAQGVQGLVDVVDMGHFRPARHGDLARRGDVAVKGSDDE